MSEVKIIATNDLSAHHLPHLNADWHEISIFALSFNPATELENGRFPFSTYSMEQIPDANSTILEIRTYLYAQQRWWNNKTFAIDKNSLERIHKVIEVLRKKLS